MEVIYYRGLNCHLACVVSVINALGVNYLQGFSALWPETEFFYDPQFQIYLSQRVREGIRRLGVEMRMLPWTSPQEREQGLARIADGELFVVGMDPFYIPWCQEYQLFHGQHYFFARMEQRAALFCFDPVYGKAGVEIEKQGICAEAFEIIRVTKTGEEQAQPTLRQTAEEILRTHPKTQERYQMKIQDCAGKERGAILPLIKKVDAMINNRHLYQHYLHAEKAGPGVSYQFFDNAFLQRWETVKNGLYKACILKDNTAAVNEVQGIYQELMREEMTVAERLLAQGKSAVIAFCAEKG